MTNKRTPSEVLMEYFERTPHPCTSCHNFDVCKQGLACPAFVNNLVHGVFEGFSTVPTKKLYKRWMK